MIDRLKNTSSFYIPYLVLFGLSMIFFFYQSHGEFVLWLNKLHNPVWDFFFKYWTHTGDGIFFSVIAIALLIFKRKVGIVLSLIGISVGLTSLFFKQVLFPSVPRPSIFFRDQEILRLVEGVDLLSQYSFPSGHAMTAFALATFIALILQSNNYSMLLLIAGCLAAISRVYLAQHFLIDIMAGSLMGVIIATSFYMAFEKYLNGENQDQENTPDQDLEEMNLDEEID